MKTGTAEEKGKGSLPEFEVEHLQRSYLIRTTCEEDQAVLSNI